MYTRARAYVCVRGGVRVDRGVGGMSETYGTSIGSIELMRVQKGWGLPFTMLDGPLDPLDQKQHTFVEV